MQQGCRPRAIGQYSSQACKSCLWALLGQTYGWSLPGCNYQSVAEPPMHISPKHLAICAGGEDVDWTDLRQIAFCPCMREPPTKGLPWSESRSAAAPACLTILPKHLWISSYGTRVLDCPCSDALALRMEWNRPPRAAQIATHLQALGAMHTKVWFASITSHHSLSLLCNRFPAFYDTNACCWPSGKSEILLLKPVVRPGFARRFA